MISLKTIFILASILVIQISASSFLSQEDAIQFLELKREIEAEKRFLYTGQEQRREAKEKYEEKCERKLLNKHLNKPRWCPQLDDWPEWNNAQAGDSKASSGSIIKNPFKIGRK